MKTFCFLLLAFVASSLASHSMKLQNLVQLCAEETKIQDNDVNLISPTPIMKKHFLCVSTKIGFQAKNGDFDLKVIPTKLKAVRSPEDVAATVTKCVVKKSTPEQSALELLLCLAFDGVDFGRIV